MANRAPARTVLTARGWGMLIGGVIVGGGGVGLATPPLVYAGVCMVSAVAVALIWMMLSVNGFLQRFPMTRREVSPRPLSVGRPGKVTVTIGGNRRSARSAALNRVMAQALDIREQAAAELTGGMGTKATVTRGDDSLSLTYSVSPVKRGRWPLGPALVHSADPMGLMWADISAGGTERVPVWPAVVDLSATAGALLGHADRVVLGARTPSPDDASLRDYREGDDLRRVHWPSSARFGTLLVRSDERAGRRPATVIMDLPRDPEGLEWTISSGASIALSVLDSGHPVRLLGGGIDPGAINHHNQQHPAAARADLLNLTVDLIGPASRAAATTRIIEAAHHAHEDAKHGEVIIGMFGALEKPALDAVIPFGEAGHGWAIVRSTGEDDVGAADTATALSAAGWRVTTTHTRADLVDVWTALLTAGDA